jgi:hypothetical protein
MHIIFAGTNDCDDNDDDDYNSSDIWTPLSAYQDYRRQLKKYMQEEPFWLMCLKFFYYVWTQFTSAFLLSAVQFYLYFIMYH